MCTIEFWQGQIVSAHISLHNWLYFSLSSCTTKSGKAPQKELEYTALYSLLERRAEKEEEREGKILSLLMKAQTFRYEVRKHPGFRITGWGWNGEHLLFMRTTMTLPILGVKHDTCIG